MSNTQEQGVHITPAQRALTARFMESVVPQAGDKRRKARGLQQTADSFVPQRLKGEVGDAHGRGGHGDPGAGSTMGGGSRAMARDPSGRR